MDNHICYPNFLYLCGLIVLKGMATKHRHTKPVIKGKLSDTCISPAEREQARRSANMAAIHGKDTKPEMVVRRWLWSHGFRYRLNSPRLPGKPDIVMRKYRTCIFVNGCFWHGHHLNLPFDDLRFTIKSSECCKIPKTNRDFWVAKIRRNKERDIRVQQELARMGWHTVTIWECELKPQVREKTLTSLAYTLNRIFLHDRSATPYEIPDEKPMMAAEDDF